MRESERGRGLGAALVRQGFAEFARRGVARVGLKVDARESDRRGRSSTSGSGSSPTDGRRSGP